jgi:hypothetical protein
MAWFKSELLSACSEEKSENNQLILQSLASTLLSIVSSFCCDTHSHVGLETYKLMRQVACLSNQNTSAYCYIEAAGSQNPSDLYFYSLPFGFPLPNNTVLSCSSCTKSVMALFGSQVNETSGFEETYSAAAIMASSKCGSDYIYTHSAIATSSALPWITDMLPFRWTVVLTLCASLTGLV